MSATITVESIENASAQFWEQMLAMHLEPCTPSDPCDEARGPHDGLRCIGAAHVVAHCDLSGVWVGRIEVRLSHGLALEATSAMLMQPVETVQADDTLDASREIANMIAGTLKSALPRPCSMTVPFAQMEAEDFCILPRTRDSLTVFFRHGSGELMVRVWEQTGVDSPTTEVLCQTGK